MNYRYNIFIKYIIRNNDHYNNYIKKLIFVIIIFYVVEITQNMVAA
jgi:hypothetical protein